MFCNAAASSGYGHHLALKRLNLSRPFNLIAQQTLGKKKKNGTLVNVVTLTLWRLTSVVSDVRRAAENTKRWLKAAPRTRKLEDVFVEPRGIYAVLKGETF